MKQIIKHKGQDIYFKTFGETRDPAIFLLHGYMESSEIWDGFAPGFSDEYYVVCVDLPGHGDSESFSEVQTMESMADAVKDVADSLGIKKMHLVGHSMGGYVTMAFRDKFPEILNSYVLFHSTCFADTEEKRTNRDREKDLVRQGRKELIINTHISKVFANSNLERMDKEMKMVKRIADKTNDNGIISALEGMKIRIARCHLFEEGRIPILLVAGAKDNYIPVEVMTRMKSMSGNSSLLVLENSGHMGFIEEKRKAVKQLKSFFRSAIIHIYENQ
jgi:pimeloyl-ACP methyl ester carboxylesterase